MQCLFQNLQVIKRAVISDSDEEPNDFLSQCSDIKSL